MNQEENWRLSQEKLSSNREEGDVNPILRGKSDSEERERDSIGRGNVTLKRGNVTQ
jgi:hypothetical protein